MRGRSHPAIPPTIRLADAVADLERRQRYVASLIRSYTWPAMDQRTPSAIILRRVAAINRENGSLFPDEGLAIAEECCEQWLRRNERPRPRR